MRRLIIALILLALFVPPASVAAPVGHVVVDLSRLIGPLLDLSSLEGSSPLKEVFEEFARRTGTRPDRDLGRIGLFIEDPTVEKVCFIIEGKFDAARLTAECMKDPSLGLAEAPLGGLIGLKTRDTRFVFTSERVVIAPLRSPYFKDEAAFRETVTRLDAIDRNAVVTLRFRPPIQMMPSLIYALPAQTPPPMAKFIESLESVALDVTESRFLLEAVVADEAAVDSARKAWQGFVEEMRARFETQEREAREAMRSASTLKLLSPEVLGKLQGAAGGRKLLEVVRLGFDGKTVRLEIDNPFNTKASFAALVPVVGVAAAIAIPNFQKAREQARQKACFANMRVLEGACELKLMDSETPPKRLTIDQLVAEKYLKAAPVCPQGGTYTLDLAGDSPQIRCSKHGKAE